MMDYEFDIGWNVEKDGYKCYDCLTDLDTNVKDGYECNDGL